MDDFNEKWDYIYINGILPFYSKHAKIPYSEIYTIIYNLCINEYSDLLYQKYAECVVEYLQKYNINDIYQLIKCWDNFLIFNKLLNKFFMYLDRCYVKSNKIDNLNTVSLKLFKKHILNNDNTERYIINNINNNHRHILYSGNILEISIIFSNLNANDMFNDILIKSAIEYYSVKSIDNIGCMSVSEYIIWVEKCYLQESKSIFYILNEYILLNNSQYIFSELYNMLLNEKFDDILRISKLFGPNESITKIFKKFLLDKCIDQNIESIITIFKKYYVLQQNIPKGFSIFFNFYS